MLRRVRRAASASPHSIEGRGDAQGVVLNTKQVSQDVHRRQLAEAQLLCQLKS